MIKKLHGRTEANMTMCTLWMNLSQRKKEKYAFILCLLLFITTAIITEREVSGQIQAQGFVFRNTEYIN